MNVAGARENVGSPIVQQYGIQCFNCKNLDILLRNAESQKGLKTIRITRKRCCCANKLRKELEAHYSYIAKIQEVPTADSGTDSDPLEQVQNDTGYNAFANDLQHFKQSESISNTCLVETDDSNVILNSPDMCNDDIQNGQNDVESDDEGVALANLIANLKLDNKQTEFKKYKVFNDRTVDYDKLKRKLNETLGQLAQKDIEIKEVDSNHFACVTKMLNDVNARTKKPKVVPISTRKPKGHANKSVATPHKKKVALKSTNQKPQSYFRMLYEKTSKTWKWWIEQQSPSGYKWVPKTKLQWIPIAKNENVQKSVSFAVDNASRITNVLKHTNSLGSNLSSVPSDLQGNDLLIGNHGYDFYTISLQELTSSTPLCLMVKASPTQAWLWHQRLSHLNFDYINLLSKKDVVISLPKLKYVKDQLCSSCELSKAKRSSFKSKVVPSLKERLNLIPMDLCGPMRVASINGKCWDS
nr:retrovirus-related Pol polyprotein from transposon TNT 1-94 [Tanacetum cinerariifolium]